MKILALVSLLTLSGGPAHAQGCDAPELSWQDVPTLAAAADEQGAGEARFTSGSAIMLRLRGDPQVTYLTLPKGAGEETSFGGLASLEVTEAGRYRVGLEEPAWVDLVRQEQPVESVEFGRMPACSGLHKQVSFDLEPGTYVLEVSGNLDDDVGVIVEAVETD